MIPAMASAETYTIKCVEGTVEIVDNSGTAFDVLNQDIGWTSANTVVYLGEIDFGADGNKYKASSITLANGWYVDGWAILHAGSDYESSLPFTQMAINETDSYQHYFDFAANMAYNCPADTLLSGGGPAIEGVTYTKPVGKQKVWLTFVGGAGNIRYVNFYTDELKAEDFLNVEGDWNSGIRLLYPNEKPDYANIASPKLIAENSTPLVPIGPETDFPDVRIDSADNISKGWGWTKEGFMVDMGEMDFGSGDFKQMVVYMVHGGENMYDYLDFYLDDASKPENLLYHFWSGMGLDGHGPYPYAKNIPSVTGKHHIIVKWIGGSTNLCAVEFVKDRVWSVQPDCGIILEDVEPNADAFHFTFRDCVEGEGDPWGYEVKCKGQWESKGNIGYTKNGTVIDFYGDGEGVDFGTEGYKRIIVNHSCDKSWAGSIDISNFSFYIDLDPELIYTKEKWDQDLASILEGHEPVAVVRLQGTGKWDVTKRTAGEFLVPVTGKHELFMVYNTRDDNTGANVFDIWMDGGKNFETGDVNGDGKVDIADVNILINIVLGSDNATKYAGRADLNKDNKVDIADINIAINLLLGVK